MTNKEIIIIDGVDISECKGYYFSPTGYHSCQDISQINDLGYEQDTLCEQNPNCYFKQLVRKTQECENYKKQFKADTKEMDDYQKEIVSQLQSIEYWQQQFQTKEQECEELKKQLMQKDEINTFFNTPIEGWSSNPCDICESKNNYEQLTQECDTLKSQLDFEVQQKECIEQECEELREELSFYKGWYKAKEEK